MENTAIMIPAKPKECANILNLIQSILVRKTFLKDYVGWVYIYCTKDNKEGLHVAKDKWVSIKHNKVLKECCHNGEVVARFWCDKVEEIHCGIHYEPEVDIGIAVLPEFTCEEYSTETLGHFDLLRKACLADYTLPYLSHDNELNHYLKSKIGYAIHISKLETFDKSKELKEFFKNCPWKYNKWNFATDTHISDDGQYLVVPIKSGYGYVPRMENAPKSWCYIEVEE